MKKIIFKELICILFSVLLAFGFYKLSEIFHIKLISALILFLGGAISLSLIFVLSVILDLSKDIKERKQNGK